MNPSSLRASYLALEARALGSPCAEAWRRAPSRAVVFGQGEFSIDQARRRILLAAPFQADLAADASLCEAPFEPGWIALVEGAGGRHSCLAAQGDPFSEQAASLLPSIGGLPCAIPACVLAERMQALASPPKP